MDASEDHEDHPVDIDDRNYQVSAINSNLFEPKQFASYKNDDELSVTYERPTLPGIDIIREQESDKDILGVFLLLDNILRPRRIYYGDGHYEIALQEIHRTFT